MLCLYPAVVVAEVVVGAGAGVVVRVGGGTPGRKVEVGVGVCLGVGAGAGPIGSTGVGLGLVLPDVVEEPGALGGGVGSTVNVQDRPITTSGGLKGSQGVRM